jgi:hypothetical protein
MADEFYDWQARFNRDGMTYGLRLELLELLRPHVTLKAPFRISPRDEAGESTSSTDTIRIQDLVEWEIVLGTDDPHEILGALRNNAQWLGALPDLLPSLTSLLREALDLMRLLGGADDRSDNSYFHQPSIAEHPQNRNFRDWTALIDLIRDAFLATARIDAEKARAEVGRWVSNPYPLFRRLAFFAATTTELFAPAVSLQWLLAEHNWWLWSVEVQREALRLLVKLAPTLSGGDETSVLSAILLGPPPNMFGVDGNDEGFERIKEREIWLRLSKYRASAGKELTEDAANMLMHISRRFPQWQLDADESDEFPFWMGDAEDWYKKKNSPKEPSALEEWLLIPGDKMTNDDWSDRCKSDFSVAILALIRLAQRGHWPTQRWRTALQVWSDNSLVSPSWDHLKGEWEAATDETLAVLAKPLSWWLQAVGKVVSNGVPEFFKLIRRVLATQTQQPFDGGNDPLFKAINHPVGQATDAVFRWWYRQGPQDGQGLSVEPKAVYSTVCNQEIVSFRYARIILAANLIALYRVDRTWTERYVLDNLNWDVDVGEACAAWTGFLRAPRLYLPLLVSIKSQLLATARHYDQLGQFGERYASFLTFVALDESEPFTRRELATATAQLPSEGLARCAMTLVQALNSAGEKRKEYWLNRIQPYVKEIWPKSVDVVSQQISNSFARLCMKAGDAFPEAVSLLKPWLSAAPNASVTLHEFREMQLAKQFPDAALTFLDAVVAPNSFLLADDLNVPLHAIRKERPDLEEDPIFERLTRQARQIGR